MGRDVFRAGGHSCAEIKIYRNSSGKIVNTVSCIRIILYRFDVKNA